MQARTSQEHTLVPRQASKRKSMIPVILWVVFVTGVGLQMMGPRLKIEHRAFIMPPSFLMEGKEIHPDAIVQRERTLQWASGLCTLTGALALAYWYRRTLRGALQIQRSPVTARSL